MTTTTRSSSAPANDASSSSSSPWLWMGATGVVAGSLLTYLSLTVWARIQQQQQQQQERSTTTDKDDHHLHPSALKAPPVSSSPSKPSSCSTAVQPQRRVLMTPEFRAEQFSRHALYFASSPPRTGSPFDSTGDALPPSTSRICIVGVGGVGSHAAVMLARGWPLACLRLIDFDLVSLSSLNRHAVATLHHVGQPKVHCLQQFLQQDLGWGDGSSSSSDHHQDNQAENSPDRPPLIMGQVQALCEMFTADTAERLLRLPHPDSPPSEAHSHNNHPTPNHNNHHTLTWDFVLDAIDDVPTKAALIAYCVQHGIRVISCMGAGGKADFTRLHASDLRAAAKDPLASKLRQALRKLLPVAPADSTSATSTQHQNNPLSYLDDMKALTIIYSSEKPVVKLADLTDEQVQEGAQEFGAVDGMRVRIMPVLGTMPAMMGQAMAAMAMTELGGKPLQPVTGDRVGKNVRHRAWQHLKRREERITRAMEAINQQHQPEYPPPQPDTTTGCQGHWVQVPSGTMPGGQILPTADGNITEMEAFTQVWVGHVQIDGDDVEYLLEIWRNRCAVTQERLGVVLELARWDLQRPSLPNNLVLLSTPAMETLDARGKEGFEPKIRRYIEDRLATCRVDR